MFKFLGFGRNTVKEKYAQCELKYEEVCKGIEGDTKDVDRSMDRLGRMYVLRFKYNNKEQEKYLYKCMERCLDTYGATKAFPYIMPYRVNKYGMATAKDTGIVGGVAIPDELVDKILEIFIEKYGYKIKIGDTIFDIYSDKAKKGAYGLNPKNKENIDGNSDKSPKRANNVSRKNNKSCNTDIDDDSDDMVIINMDARKCNKTYSLVNKKVESQTCISRPDVSVCK